MSISPEIRTRVAPSPTGDPHIGTAFQLLFDYCHAKRHGGKVILRIEDTDQTRSTRESEQAIYEALRWIGLTWDEGPDVGGPYGPYRQSERTGIYREHCQTLIDKGHAYRCFCTAERLDAVRREAGEGFSGYDRHCANLPAEEVQHNIDAGLPYVVRLCVPGEGDCVFTDLLRGEIRMPWNSIDDQILMKSDNFPTYHLANVVDDHLMKITNVIRGEEWIPSTPKHVLLYRYFGWDAPEFCHLPLLRNPDKSKLSKRKNPTSILYYRQAGFLPEALLNYLGMMGYTLPDGREMFSLQEMVETFDIKRVSLGGPIFDIGKLTWLNGRYIRETMDAPALLGRMKQWLLNDETMLKILPFVQSRMERLSDFVPKVAFFFADKPEYDPQALIPKKMDGAQVARLLKIGQWELEKLRKWNKDDIQNVFTKMTEVEGIKMRDLVPPFYVAMSGSTTSTPLFDSMEVLGSDMTRRRIVYALEALALAGFAISSKAMKEMEKEYQGKYGQEK